MTKEIRLDDIMGKLEIIEQKLDMLTSWHRSQRVCAEKEKKEEKKHQHWAKEATQ